jgi:hypothetical protein
MFKNTWNFVKNHKKGFVIGGLALLATVAVGAMAKGKEEPSMIESPVYEVTDADDQAAIDELENLENSDVE